MTALARQHEGGGGSETVKYMGPIDVICGAYLRVSIHHNTSRRALEVQARQAAQGVSTGLWGRRARPWASRVCGPRADAGKNM